MIRMEIALILILAFVAGIYFSARRRQTALHKTFSVLLIVVIVHLMFDAATIYTVNHLAQVPLVLNDVLHRDTGWKLFGGTLCICKLCQCGGVSYTLFMAAACKLEADGQ